jgi:RNA polymerase sigma-70 factor (ECF subfamily)
MMAQTATPQTRHTTFVTEPSKTWFSRKVRENLDALFGVAMRLTRSKADAEDLVADSISQAWSALASLEDRSRFRSWVFRIMHNRFISDCRKRAARPIELDINEQDEEEDNYQVTSFLLEQSDEYLKWWANPEKDLVNRMLGDQITRAIGRLPEAFRIVVLLINVDGLRYDEAAEVLGVPTGTVRSRMKRGRTLLQKALWEQARDAGLVSSEHRSET